VEEPINIWNSARQKSAWLEWQQHFGSTLIVGILDKKEKRLRTVGDWRMGKK
jgi:hypothetical protein